MDLQILRKQSILNHLKRLKKEGSLTQDGAMDLRQEFERSNHIMNHMIRGFINPAGIWITMFVFGSTGLALWFNSFSLKTRILTFKNICNLVPYVFLPLVFSNMFAKRRFGDIAEAKKFISMRNESYLIDEEFYDILDKLTKSDLNY